MDDVDVLEDHERVGSESLGDVQANGAVGHVVLKVLRNERAAGEHLGLALHKLEGDHVVVLRGGRGG